MNSPYFGLVGSLKTRWPSVAHLIHYYVDSKSSQKPNIAVIDFEDRGVARKEEFSLVDDFSLFLNRHPHETGSRLVIVEDPSVQVIDFLGNQFQLDPEFFAMHILNHHWYGMSSGRQTIPASKATIREGSFLRIRYIQARPTSAEKPSGDNKQWTKSWRKSYTTANMNVTRKGSIQKLKSVERHLMAFSRHHLTVWMRDVGNGNWLGITLSSKK